jgi:hypothetical protein
MLAPVVSVGWPGTLKCCKVLGTRVTAMSVEAVVRILMVNVTHRDMRRTRFYVWPASLPCSIRKRLDVAAITSARALCTCDWHDHPIDCM